MKAYFVGSISGRSKYLANYQHIVDILKRHGHEVFEDTLKVADEEVYGLTDDKKVEFYKQVLKWIKAADVMIAEVSHPSLGIGHEISVALERSKPVILLHTEDSSAPHFLQGIDSDKLVVISYNSDNLEEGLLDALNYSSELSDTRFNFFISPRQLQYLDKIAKDQRIPRSVFLRRLIEKDMADNDTFGE